MELELNNAKLSDLHREVFATDRDASQTALTMIAVSGRLTCFTGGTSVGRTRWLHALMGFEPLAEGFVCLDGEPLTPQSAPLFRRLMAYAPARLEPVGLLHPVEPPTVEQVFHLLRNREQPISNAILAEEVRRLQSGASISILPEGEVTEGRGGSDPRFQLIAVASLLGTPIVLVDDPPVTAVPYLSGLASSGRMVILTSDEAAVHDASHLIVPIS